MFYTALMRDRVAAENPGMTSAAEIARLIGAEWTLLAPEDKAKYEAMSEASDPDATSMSHDDLASSVASAADRAVTDVAFASLHQESLNAKAQIAALENTLREQAAGLQKQAAELAMVQKQQRALAYESQPMDFASPHATSPRGTAAKAKVLATSSGWRPGGRPNTPSSDWRLPPQPPLQPAAASASAGRCSHRRLKPALPTGDVPLRSAPSEAEELKEPPAPRAPMRPEYVTHMKRYSMVKDKDFAKNHQVTRDLRKAKAAVDASVAARTGGAASANLANTDIATVRAKLRELAQGIEGLIAELSGARTAAVSATDEVLEQVEHVFKNDDEKKKLVRAMLVKVARANNRVHECSHNVEAELGEFTFQAPKWVVERLGDALKEAARLRHDLGAVRGQLALEEKHEPVCRAIFRSTLSEFEQAYEAEVNFNTWQAKKARDELKKQMTVHERVYKKELLVMEAQYKALLNELEQSQEALASEKAERALQEENMLHALNLEKEERAKEVDKLQMTILGMQRKSQSDIKRAKMQVEVVEQEKDVSSGTLLFELNRLRRVQAEALAIGNPHKARELLMYESFKRKTNLSAGSIEKAKHDSSMTWRGTDSKLDLSQQRPHSARATEKGISTCPKDCPHCNGGRFPFGARPETKAERVQRERTIQGLHGAVRDSEMAMRRRTDKEAEKASASATARKK